MPAQEIFKKELQLLVQNITQGKLKHKNFNSHPTARTTDSILYGIVSSLELERELVMMGFLLARRAIAKGLNIKSSCIYRLLIPCIIVSEKFINESHNSLESYSLLSGVPIIHLIELEASLLELLDYSLIPVEQQINDFRLQFLMEQ